MKNREYFEAIQELKAEVKEIRSCFESWYEEQKNLLKVSGVDVHSRALSNGARDVRRFVTEAEVGIYGLIHILQHELNESANQMRVNEFKDVLVCFYASMRADMNKTEKAVRRAIKAKQSKELSKND